jgi:catechol 2,3-dioxygenase-like lactoylglutathione lyase family enzyme
MAETGTRPGISHVGIVSVNVRDLDAAIAFYTEKLGFEKTTDAPMGPDARWVEVAPVGAQTRLSLIAAGNPAYEPERIGTMVSTFEVNGFEATCEALKAQGVEFRREPKQEFFGWWAEILDADGNILGLHA